jgi:hypothetical protein
MYAIVAKERRTVFQHYALKLKSLKMSCSREPDALSGSWYLLLELVKAQRGLRRYRKVRHCGLHPRSISWGPGSHDCQPTQQVRGVTPLSLLPSPPPHQFVL